jgi:hypothetical protein
MPPCHASHAGKQGTRNRKAIVAACVVALLVCAGLLVGLLVGLLPRKSSSSSTGTAALDAQEIANLQQLPTPGSEAARKLLTDPTTPGGVMCWTLVPVEEEALYSVSRVHSWQRQRHQWQAGVTNPTSMVLLVLLQANLLDGGLY